MKKTCLWMVVFTLFFLGPSFPEESLPLAAGICINKAQGLFQEGKVPKAIETLEAFRDKGRGLDPETARKKGYSHPLIHFMLGNYYLSLDPAGEAKEPPRSRIQKAAETYQACLKEDPGFTPAWLNLAKCRYELEDYEKAAQAFEQGDATSETPRPDPLYFAAVCRFQAHQLPEARELFHRLFSRHPDAVTPAWKETLVNILFAMEKFQEALPLIEDLAGQSDPAKAKKFKEILLHQYLSLGMADKALAYAEELIGNDPLEPKWWKALCHIHLNENQPAKGLTALIITGYLVPLTPEEQSLAADLYLTLDIPDQALKMYDRLDKESMNPDHVIKAGQAAIMAHEPDQALAWIEKGLSSFENPELLQMKAGILFTRENYGQAAHTYQKMIALHESGTDQTQNMGQIWLMLGFSSMNAGNLSQARQAFARALEYETSRKQARSALDGLAKSHLP